MIDAGEFDYVIAGGGTAGCVVAARLSEDPNVTVCLLEAGPTDVNDGAILRLEDWMYLLDSGYDWDYLVEPQEKGNSFLRHARAKVLGGCSSHNSCIAFWTPKEDLDEWAAMGCEGWSSADCWPLIKRLETNDGPGDHHGRDGPVNIRTVPPDDPCGVAMLEAAAQAGLPTSRYNEGYTVTNGAGWFQINSAPDNTRMSSSHAYLHPVLGSRQNLEVRTHCWVKRVAIDDGRATAVEYLTPDLLTQASVRARREVILSAGAIDTPKLLMLSGVGPAEHLQEFGIQTLVNSPGVGANLDDHVEGIVQWDAKKPMVRHSTQWWEIGLFATSEEGLDRPDLMMHYGSVPFDMNTARWGYPTTENGFCLTPNVCRGRSRGTVRLRSRDYRDRARVDPRYFTDPDGHDERVMAFGMRLARKIVSQPALAEWAGEELAPGPDAQTDDELIDYMHKTHNTVYHPACTAHMGPDSDPTAVVDPRLRVRGVRALRIADGSILPFLPAINPCITTMMVGEKCADMLKEDARQGADPVQQLRVVRGGTVEIVHDGTVLDLLGEGELFGHASMLSGLPTPFEARAAEHVTCYRIDAEVARGLLADPAGLRYVARSLLERPSGRALTELDSARDPAHEPVGTLLRGRPVVCDPQTPIRDVVRSMDVARATCAVLDLGDGSLGILTDRDLRTRVLACGLGGDTPASAAMSAPAYSCGPDRLGADILLEMLDRGFRHFPVVSATGEILGVVEDVDLVAAYARSSFYLRQRIGVAQTVEELASAARELVPTVIAMHDARIAATNIMAVYSVVIDALTRRVLEVRVSEDDGPPASFAWLALGSQGRREMMPASDMDTAVVLFGDANDASARSRMQSFAAKATADLETCGMHPDPHGATASNPAFVRSLHSWQRAARSWIADPTQDKALILASVLVDSRPVWGVHTGTPVADTFRLAERSPVLLRMLARFALSHRPPTGFLRGLVVEHGGEHRGRLDLKHGGMIPIVDLARWAGMAAGVTSASTIERLRAAGSAGTLPRSDAQTLEDAFELIAALRLGHQVRQLRAGEPPDDYVDPGGLSGLTRSHLKEAFRAVASVQKHVATELKGVAP